MSFISNLASSAHVSSDPPRSIEAADLMNSPTVGNLPSEQEGEIPPAIPDEPIVKSNLDIFLENLPAVIGKGTSQLYPLMDCVKKILMKKLKQIWPEMVKKMGRQVAKKYYYSLQTDISEGRWDEILRLDKDMETYGMNFIYK